MALGYSFAVTSLPCTLTRSVAIALLSVAPSLAQQATSPDVGDDAPPAWIRLFNGRDLTGWTPKIRGYALGDNHADTFRVVDGLLTVSYDNYEGPFAGRFGHLFYALEFSNYRLRCEYRFVGEQYEGGAGWAWANSGLMLHGQPAETMGRDQDFPVSIEVQLLGGKAAGERPTANLCTPGTNVVRDGELWTRHCWNSTSPTFRGDRWVTVEVEIRGDTVRHLVDGDTVMTYDDPQLDPRDEDAEKLLADGRGIALRHGSISLQSESHPIQFRKVELMPLDEPGPWLVPLADALADHFTTGGNWSLTDGVVSLEPREGETRGRRFDGHLWLNDSYGDFEATFDYLLEEGGDSGFYFHVGDRSRPIATGIEVQLATTPTDRREPTSRAAGGLIPGGPPTKNAARPAGEWNRMRVLCEHGSVSVTLNGALVHSMRLDDETIADRPRAGAVGFEDHGRPVVIRRFRIRAL